MARKLSAKHAQFYIGGAKVLQAHNLAISIEVDTLTDKAFEQLWDEPEIEGGRWTASAERFIDTVGPTFLATVGLSINQNMLYRVEMYDEPGHLVLRGNCKIVRGGRTMPRSGSQNETLEVLGFGAPLYIG